MLFRNNQPRSCSYCTYGTKIEDGMILCTKKGVRAQDDACRRFSYDPCKRIPPRPKAPDFTGYSEEDFKL